MPLLLFPDIGWEEVTEPGGEKYKIRPLGRDKNGFWWDLALFEPGPYKPHIHDRAHSVIHVMSGHGVAIVNGKHSFYTPGHVLDILNGVPHGFMVEERTVLLTKLSHPILDPKTGALDMRSA